MKTIIKKYAPATIAITMFAVFLANYIYTSMKVADMKRETQIVVEEAEKRIAKAQENSQIELTKLMIDKANSQNDIIYNYRQEKEEQATEAKRIYEAHVWYKECLAVTWELELRDKVIDFQCQEYAVFNWLDYPQLIWDETIYNFLERFASYNIDTTRKELGLN